MVDEPLILSLKLDAETFALADGLRRAHFPVARNILPAHLTLFHALPGEALQNVLGTLKEVAADTTPLELELPRLRFLGNGTAIEVRSPELEEFRARLRERWLPWLTLQDQQKFRPHITIQNKAPASEAKALYENLAPIWSPLSGTSCASALWRYVGGPWELVEEVPFQRSEASGTPNT